MSIARASFITLLAQVALLGLQVVSGVLLTRALGPVGYGELALVITTAMLLATFCQMGLSSGATQAWAAWGKGHPALLRAYLGLALGMAVASGLLFAMLPMTPLGRLVAGISPDALRLGAWMAPLVLLPLLLEHALKLEGSLGRWNVARLLPKIVTVGMLVAILGPTLWAAFNQYGLAPRALARAIEAAPISTATALAIALAAATAGLIPLLLPLVVTAMRPENSPAATADAGTVPPMRLLISGAWRGWPGIVALYLLARIDFYIVAAYLPEEELGLYGVAHALAELATMASFALNQAILPHAAHRDASVAHAVAGRSMRHNLLYSGLAALIVALAATPLVGIYAGSPYLLAASPLRLVLPALVCQFVFGMYGALASRHGWYGRTNLILAVAVVAEASLTLNVLPIYGLPGVAGVKSLVHIAVLVVFATWFHRAGLVPISSLFKFDAADVAAWRRMANRVPGPWPWRVEALVA